MSQYRHSQTNWKFVQTLGSGGFGEVSLWVNAETEQSVAIKRCTKEVDKLALDEQSKLKIRWEQESAWMRGINTEHIVRACPELCEDLIAEQNRFVKLPVIAMEYCDGGSLRTKLNQIENVNGFSEHDVREVLRALRKAVFHLHDQFKITHRDIKPDNVVIKFGIDGEPIYKLTDMGYARILDQNTIVGSMVGSHNYFAPEIVESAEYKNSVDYWSLGILAFEIMCGVYPFLQDTTVFEILKNIKQKPAGCIAITKSNDGKLSHHSQIFPENRLSSAFCRVMEPWLQIALEADGRKRGYEATDEVQRHRPELTFYTKLDAALDAKVLTVFWLNRCQFLSYCIDESTQMEDLFFLMEQDTKVTRDKFYFVLPAGHTLTQLTPQMKPLQLYEEQFAVEDKPMLYLVDFENKELCKPESPVISASIHLTFMPNVKLHPRLLKECLIHTLFVHHNELRRIYESINGIEEFAMNLESEIMTHEQNVNAFKEKIVHVNGQAAHYETMVMMGKQILHEQAIANNETVDNEWDVIAQNIRNLSSEYLCIHRRLKNILDRIREFIKKSPLKTYQDKVADLVKQFENLFEDVRDKGRPINTDEIRSHVSSLLRVRTDFFDETFKCLQKTEQPSSSNQKINFLFEIHLEFKMIMGNLLENQSLWKDSQTKIAQKTKDYMMKFGEKFCNRKNNEENSVFRMIESMDTLDLDSGELSTSLACNGDVDFLELATGDLIKDAQHVTQAIKSLWTLRSIDEQSSTSDHDH